MAVNSGTAALHSALFAAGIGPGDEVITTPLTFVATAAAVVHCGARPIFADIQSDGFNIDPEKIKAKIRRRTKAVIAVHFAGEPCDIRRIRSICKSNGLSLIEDAAHALGAVYRGKPVGSTGDLTTFSFHPVKHITTAEGGMITTQNPEWDRRMRMFRNHGMTADARQRVQTRSWKYDVLFPAFNYRLSDICAALGESQLAKLPVFLRKRKRIADEYRKRLREVDEIQLPADPREPDSAHAWHLFVIRILSKDVGLRDRIFERMRHRGIGVNVHYPPLHLLTCFRRRFGFKPGQFPNAERTFRQSISLPIFPAMTSADIDRVVAELKRSLVT